MESEGDIMYKGYKISYWQALSNKKWYFYIALPNIILKSHAIPYDSPEDAIKDAKKQVDFEIAIESN